MYLIMLTYPCNVDPPYTPPLYSKIERFTRAYLFPIFAIKHNYGVKNIFFLSLQLDAVPCGGCKMSSLTHL